MQNTKKALPVMILRVLERYTDEGHRLTQGQIIERLAEDFGTECERKAVARNIGMLQELGHDISHSREGYALLARRFDPTQTRMLMDAVLTSSYISAKDARELLQGLMDEQSVYFARQQRHLQWAHRFPRTHNPQVFYTIEVLLEAIDTRRRVAFTYSHYGADRVLRPVRGEKYRKSPYYILPKKGEYYLICDLVEEDGVDNFRLEFISDIEILPEAAALPDFELHAHYNEQIYMMRGRSVDAVLKVETWIIEQMFDWLGFDIHLEKLDEHYTLVRTRANFQALLYFCLQFILSVEVLQPQEVRDFLPDFLRVGLEKYTVPAGDYNSDAHVRVDRQIRRRRQPQ